MAKISTSQVRGVGRKRSAPWRYEELVLATELAFLNGWGQLDSTNKDVMKLSSLLNSGTLVPIQDRSATFRNPNGVSRKIADIVTSHPKYQGKPTKGGKLDKVVLFKFLESPTEMLEEAKSIRNAYIRLKKRDLPKSNLAGYKIKVIEKNSEWGYGKDRERNKLIEESGVEAALKYLISTGRTFLKDCQKFGVGYDFEFLGPSGIERVEVKGVAGSDISFNLTSKEYRMSQSDESWKLIVVTNALNKSPNVNEFAGSDLNRMSISPTQFRVNLI